MTLLPPEDVENYHKHKYWKDYEIDTPTFELTPGEKSDMSPFLIHLTGKEQIFSILKGKDQSDKNNFGWGYLQANIPETNTDSRYKAKVVCFTESPIFTLDFFRYRNYKRWKNDHRYGIGFNKKVLVNRGVRPVIYADEEFINYIIKSWNKLIGETSENQSKISKKSTNRASNNKPKTRTLELIDILNKIYPLLFPLLEYKDKQGFMWEREWRYPNEEGLEFSHEDIKIICCPKEEEIEIQKIIGKKIANKIKFIRTWEEYEEITDYIISQEKNKDKREYSYQDSIKNRNFYKYRLEISRKLINNYKTQEEQSEEFLKKSQDKIDKIEQIISKYSPYLNKIGVTLDIKKAIQNCPINIIEGAFKATIEYYFKQEEKKADFWANASLKKALNPEYPWTPSNNWTDEYLNKLNINE